MSFTRALITILDNITETSMPFNEFVLFRANHFPNEKQILIVCGPKEDLPKVEIPKTLEIVYAGRRLIGIRKSIKRTVSELKAQVIPFVIHLHQVQSGFLSEIAMLGMGLRRNTLFSVHSTFSGYKFHNKVLSFINTLFAHRTICVSNTSYQDYPRVTKWIKGNRIQAIQNGVDTERIDSLLSASKPLNTDYVDFIYVARLIPLKNHLFLLRVLEKCDDRIHFTFVGAEDAGQTVRKKANELGIVDRITFTGLIPRNEVFSQLQCADYYISSSTLEGLPVSVLEAMYCGLPCILSDIPQHREVGGPGATIIPFDVEKWAIEINRLADESDQQKTEIRKKTRDYVSMNYSLRSMHEQYDAVYDLLRRRY